MGSQYALNLSFTSGLKRIALGNHFRWETIAGESDSQTRPGRPWHPCVGSQIYFPMPQLRTWLCPWWWRDLGCRLKSQDRVFPNKCALLPGSCVGAGRHHMVTFGLNVASWPTLFLCTGNGRLGKVGRKSGNGSVGCFRRATRNRGRGWSGCDLRAQWPSLPLSRSHDMLATIERKSRLFEPTQAETYILVNDGIQSLHRLNYHHSLAVLNPVKEWMGNNVHAIVARPRTHGEAK